MEDKNNFPMIIITASGFKLIKSVEDLPGGLPFRIFARGAYTCDKVRLSLLNYAYELGKQDGQAS